MGLIDKIEEIRKKPEYIRRRYVWIGVFISMIFVMIIWIFSFKLTVKPVEIKNQRGDNLKKNFEDAKNQIPSIKEMFEGSGLNPSEETGQENNAPDITNPDLENPGSSPAGNENQPNANNPNPLEQEGVKPDNNQQ